MNPDQIRLALSGQYRAGLAMLREAIDRCPGEIWTAGRHPREFWRIAFHTCFYTHLYLEAHYDNFELWAKDPRPNDDVYIRDIAAPLAKADLIEYCDFIAARIDPKLAAMDLASPESGFFWYEMTKLEHQILTVRHIQDHAGQLRDRLLESADYPEDHLDWISSGSS